MKTSQKSYDNTPSLYLITTPIGNMDDITYRAIKTMEEVDILLAEDTRVTKLLLNHFGIKNKLIANHKFNEENNVEQIISYLKKGMNVGLVSDRGTPIISDPGYEAAKKIIEEGFNVISIPGVTALIPALTSSGLIPQPFLFYGFLNSKDSKQKKELETLKNEKSTIIFYEAPHRITNTLNNILEVFGDRDCSISREITKKFEEIYRGKISEVLPLLENAKGEMVIVVAGNNNVNTFSNLTIVEHVNLYIKEGKTVMDSIKLVAKERKITKNEVYSSYHKGGDL
ncbi:MAG: 16S rRNA (cytidine(1402)-2'-O)-methyltransferase [Candidatus Faecisoma sp.]|nr:16S rRNA (cytidine(1402)-2'-O)-methyltransferase [Acholeplasma sp.]MDY2893096.1 16S rRNA (cytidine(1402)-2'-O)-methyltransferase [Candidatus Faecisoma sp.]